MQTPLEEKSSLEEIRSRFDADVECIALKPSMVDFIAPDPVVVVLPQTGFSDAEREAPPAMAPAMLCCIA